MYIGQNFSEHQEENAKWFRRGRINYNRVLTCFSKIHRKNLKKLAIFFKITIHFHPSHPWSNIINSTFSVFVGLVLTKIKHYFHNVIETNTFFLAIHSYTKSK